MTSDLCFIVNVFNVIIISVDNFVCVLLYVIERVYRLLSLNPEYNHNHNQTMKVLRENNIMVFVNFQKLLLILIAHLAKPWKFACS